MDAVKRYVRSPPAVIAGAVEDAISAIGPVVIDEIPLTPERVRGYIDRAQQSVVSQ